MVVLPGSSTGPLLAQAFAFQLDAVGIVDEPVQDGVGQGRVADDVVPAMSCQRSTGTWLVMISDPAL